MIVCTVVVKRGLLLLRTRTRWVKGVGGGGGGKLIIAAGFVACFRLWRLHRGCWISTRRGNTRRNEARRSGVGSRKNTSKKKHIITSMTTVCRQKQFWLGFEWLPASTALIDLSVCRQKLRDILTEAASALLPRSARMSRSPCHQSGSALCQSLVPPQNTAGASAEGERGRSTEFRVLPSVFLLFLFVCLFSFNIVVVIQ